jgi:hypothetical protein
VTDDVRKILTALVTLGTNVSCQNGRYELDKAGYTELRRLVRASMEAVEQAKKPVLVFNIDPATWRELPFTMTPPKTVAAAPLVCKTTFTEVVRATQDAYLAKNGVLYDVSTHRPVSTGDHRGGQIVAEPKWRGYLMSDVRAVWARVWKSGDEVQLELGGSLVFWNVDHYTNADSPSPGGGPRRHEETLREAGLRRPEEPDYKAQGK